MIAARLVLLWALAFGPPEVEPAPVVAPAPAPEVEPEPDQAQQPSGFVITPGVAPPRNTWPYQQLCDLEPALRPACLMLGAELFSGYQYQNTGGQGFSEFLLDRAELGSEMIWRPITQLDAGARVRLEALRSAGPDSLQGIDGNALVVRAAQAFGHLATHLGPIDLGLRVGLVPERWVEQVEKGYDTRAIAPLGSERRGFFDTADLGASLTISGWRSLVELDLEFVNGEGRSQREQNTGKNTTVMLTVRPLRRPTKAGPVELALHGIFRDGSLGPASARNHRTGGALSFRSPWAFAGGEYVRAFGYRERGDVQADLVSAWASARVAPWGAKHFDPTKRFAPWGGVYLHYEHARLDVSVANAAIDSLGAGAFAELFPYVERNARRVRLYVGYQWDGYGPNAGGLPGSPAAQTTHRVLVTLHLLGLARLHLERR